MKSKKLLLAYATLVVALLAKTGCTPPQSSHEHQKALREAFTQPASNAPAEAPLPGQLEGQAEERSPASTGMDTMEPTLPMADSSSPKALGKTIKRVTHSIKKVDWIEPPQESQESEEAAIEDDIGESHPAAGPPVCTSVEYAGTGVNALEADRTLSNRVQVAFTDSKEILLGWLSQNKARFPTATYTFLESQIKNAKLRTDAGDVDLQWRGMGAWTRDTATGDPTVKLGSGFYTLMKKQPARAKFELTRLLAQTWSPCELEKKKIEQPWSAYLRCMGFSGSGVDPSVMGCGQGGYSEAGWAVSSAVAATVTNPGCQIPAFNEPLHAECPKNFLLPLVVGTKADTNLRRPASETQEARR